MPPVTRSRAKTGQGRWRARARLGHAAASAVWSASPVLIVGLAAVSLAAGLISPATAWLQRDVLDAVVPLGRAGAAQAHPGLSSRDLALVAALGAAGVAAAVVPQAQQYIQATVSRVVGAAVYDRAYRAVSSWPGITRFESPAFADKLQLTNQVAQGSASSLVTATLGIGQAAVTAATFAATLAVINPLLTVATTGVQAVAIAASLGNARRQALLRVENVYRARRQSSFSTLLVSAMAARRCGCSASATSCVAGRWRNWTSSTAPGAPWTAASCASSPSWAR